MINGYPMRDLRCGVTFSVLLLFSVADAAHATPINPFVAVIETMCATTSTCSNQTPNIGATFGTGNGSAVSSTARSGAIYTLTRIVSPVAEPTGSTLRGTGIALMKNRLRLFGSRRKE
jgi:hypothetical protein